MNLNLPIDLTPVDASGGPVTTNGGITGKYVSMADALRAWLVVTLKQAVGFAEVVSLKQATAVAGTGVKAGPTSVIWANEDCAGSDTWVRQTAGAAYTTAADIKVKKVIIEVDPAALDAAGGFDCVGWTASDSSQATNLASADWYIQPRYPQTPNISVVVD